MSLIFLYQITRKTLVDRYCITPQSRDQSRKCRSCPSVCGCAGSEDRASNQVIIRICCYFNNTSKSSTCLNYSCDFTKVRSNGNDCLIMDSVTFRDEKIRRIYEAFGHIHDRSQSPMTFLLLQHAMQFTFMGKTNDAVSIC